MINVWNSFWNCDMIFLSAAVARSVCQEATRFSNGLGTADSSAHHGAALSWAVPSSKMVSPAHPQIFSFHYPDFISIMQRISPFSVMLCVLLRCQLLSALKCKLSERKDSLVTLLWAFPGPRAAGDTCGEPYTTQRQAAGQLEVMQKKKIGCKDRFN